MALTIGAFIALVAAATAVLAAGATLSCETATAAEEATPQRMDAARSAVVAATNAFSKDLYLQAARPAANNLVICPLGVAVVLALAWHGARGATAQQLSQALHLPDDRPLVIDGFSALLRPLQSAPAGAREPELRVASEAFARRGVRLRRGFRRAARRLGAGAQQLDFAGDPEGARRAVNAWAARRTHGAIRELFAPGSPSKNTLLVLVNALYFKADWRKQFDKNSTEMKPFYLPDGSQVDVPTMHKHSEYSYTVISDIKAKALILHYQGPNSDMRMLIVLPDSADGLPELEANLGRWDPSAFHWERRTVDLRLPKLRIEAFHQLQDELQQLGVNDVFSNRADLSGIGDDGMYVSQVVQKTFIEVNEKGTEAGAASGLEGMYFSLPPPPADFFADRPFLFFVMKEDLILFLGRVLDPRDKGTT